MSKQDLDDRSVSGGRGNNGNAGNRRKTTADLGLQVVEHVYQRMMISSKCSVRDKRGFTWWNKDIAQRVWADPSNRTRGVMVSRLHARTDLLDGFRPSEASLSLINDLSKQSTLSGFIQNDNCPSQLQLAASISVHLRTFKMVMELFTIVVAIQAAEARAKTHSLTGILGASPAASSHPTSGPRPQYDGMADAVAGPMKLFGQEPSVWSGNECEAALASIESSGWCLTATGDHNSFAAELPFHRMTSLLTVKTDEVHPRLGHGAFLRLSIPARHAKAEAHRLVLEFNEWELTEVSGIHCLGSWYADPQGLAYVTFLPNMARRPGLLSVMAMSMLGRAKWVAEDVYADNWKQSVKQAKPAMGASWKDKQQ